MNDWRKTLWAYYKPERLIEVIETLRDLDFSSEIIRDVINRIGDIEHTEIHIRCRALVTAGFEIDCPNYSTKRWNELVTGRRTLIGKYSTNHYCNGRKVKEILEEYELSPGTILIEHILNKHPPLSNLIHVSIIFVCPKVAPNVEKVQIQSR